MTDMNITPTLRSAKRLFKTMKLTETTSKTQKKNGTVMYTDDLMPNVSYTFHKNGYYRRRIKYGEFGESNIYYDNYQLNRTQKNPDCGYIRDRILVKDLAKQMVLASSAIDHYRQRADANGFDWTHYG